MALGLWSRIDASSLKGFSSYASLLFEAAQALSFEFGLVVASEGSTSKNGSGSSWQPRHEPCQDEDSIAAHGVTQKKNLNTLGIQNHKALHPFYGGVLIIRILRCKASTKIPLTLPCLCTPMSDMPEVPQRQLGSKEPRRRFRVPLDPPA